MTTGLGTTNYENTATVNGGSRSTARVIVPWEDRITWRDAYLRAVDAYDANLKVSSVTFHPYPPGDKSLKEAELVIECAPAYKVDRRKPNEPLRWRTEWYEEAFTVKGGYTWEGGAQILNQTILPVKRVACKRIVGSGTRTAKGDYDSYVGRVNSDAFMGYAAGLVYCQTISEVERMNDDGVMVFDVELSLIWKEKDWNKFWNETTGTWAYIVVSGGTDKVYPATAFAGLLT